MAIYLGMQVYSLKGVRTLAKLGPGIRASHKAKPDGLLLHEDFLFAQWPLHVAFRQYWRDYDAMEAWTRTLPHQKSLCKTVGGGGLFLRGGGLTFLADSGGTGFWHEAYSVRGGFEAVYDDMRKPPGLMRIAPNLPARGPLFSSRGPAGRAVQGGARLRRERAPDLTRAQARNSATIGTTASGRSNCGMWAAAVSTSARAPGIRRAKSCA